MTTPSFEEFAADAKSRGFDEVVVRNWPPGTTLASHTHPFALSALVVQGEMWLGVGESVRHLRPGDRFALDLEEPHSERYGPDGATYWVARRNATPGD